MSTCTDVTSSGDWAYYLDNVPCSILCGEHGFNLGLMDAEAQDQAQISLQGQILLCSSNCNCLRLHGPRSGRKRLSSVLVLAERVYITLAAVESIRPCR